MRWPWTRHVMDDETTQILADMDALDGQVAELNSELRRALKHNHFSELVNAALRKAAEQ